MKKKNVVGVVGAMALTAAIAVTGTMAYLSFVTDQKVNKFTSNSEIDGEITESEWEHGETGWDDYLPGDATNKNPKVEISADSVDARIAMKVVCIDNDGGEISFEDFKSKYANIYYKDGNGNLVEGINPQFIQYEGKGFYVYNGIVETNGESPELFNSVKVNTGIKRVYTTATKEQKVKTCKIDGNGNIKVDGNGNKVCSDAVSGTIMVENTEKVFLVENGQEKEVDNKEVKLPSFEIRVTGYAVQAAGTDTTYTQLLADLAGL